MKRYRYISIWDIPLISFKDRLFSCKVLVFIFVFNNRKKCNLDNVLKKVGRFRLKGGMIWVKRWDDLGQKVGRFESKGGMIWIKRWDDLS